MKPKSLNLRMVQNSKPAGKAFKKKNAVKKTNNSLEFRFSKGNKSALEQRTFISGNDKSKSSESAKNKVPSLHKHSNGVSKAVKTSREKSGGSVLPVKESVEKNQPRKRKIDEASDNIIQNWKVPRKTVEKDEPKAHTNGEKEIHSKPTVNDDSKPTKKKWKRKNKKKKKKVSENEGDAESGYKPVVIVRDSKDISANWKNLKHIIAKQDREQALEKLSNEAPHKKRRREKHAISDEKQLPKKRERKSLNTMIEEQKRQTEAYEEQMKKRSTKGGKEKEEKADIWFDNVDPILLGEEYEDEGDNEKPDSQQKQNDDEKGDQNSLDSVGDGKAVAIDCEMVGIGIDGRESMLARVSIVDQYCKVIYDKYVKPQEPVVDYRTEFSGIRPEDIKDGHDFKTVQAEVAKILDGKILVGHGLDNDLRALFLQHPRSRIRDTAKYKPFKTMFRGFTPKLKLLTKKILGADIQAGEHDSVQDAQAVMRIYTVHKKKWDKMKKKVFDKSKKKKKKQETPDS